MAQLDNTALIRQGLESSFVDTALVDEAMVSRYADMARAPPPKAKPRPPISPAAAPNKALGLAASAGALDLSRAYSTLSDTEDGVCGGF